MDGSRKFDMYRWDSRILIYNKFNRIVNKNRSSTSFFLLEAGFLREPPV